MAQNQSSANLSLNSDYVCVKRSPHSRLWQRYASQTNLSGVVRTNLHSYTELATGLCYLENGQYVDSVEQINPVADGAEAVQGPHRVHWMANANTPTGAVKLITPDHKLLLSTVYGLTYFDTSSGSNVLLAQLQDSTATIVGPNSLVYSNAFTNISADIRYAYRKSGLSQDIVLHQQPPSPADYGLNPATTYLGVMTEFFDPPQPIKSTVTANDVSDDRRLNFGEMNMGVGTAFLTPTDRRSLGRVQVLKTWTNIDNRTFLIEEVPYPSVSNLLSSLHSSWIKPDRNKVRRSVFLEQPKPRKVSSVKTVEQLKLGKLNANEKSLVLDYDIYYSDAAPYTFQADTTYLLSGFCYMTSSATFEGGTILKYANNSTAELNLFSGPVQFDTSAYRPAIFTSMNDDSVGEQISGSTGNPSNDYAGSIALNLDDLYAAGVINLQGVRFSHLATAVQWSEGGYGVEPFQESMNDFQIVNCQVAINPEGYGNALNLNNGLIYNIESEVFCQFEPAWALNGINLTIHDCADFDPGSWGAITLVNSLLVGVTNFWSEDGYAGGYDVVLDTDPGGVFQTVGAASHYLADNTYQGQGTTDIDSSVLADLQTKTTYPPVVIPFGWFTNDYTFFPQAQRDNNGSTLDLGYHYDPLDYVIDIAISNATATVLPGTALAAAGPYQYGAWLYSKASFNCVGTATSPNYFVRYNAVQEQSNTNWETTTWDAMLYDNSMDSSLPNVNFRFTDFVVLGGVEEQFDAEFGNVSPFNMQDCQVYGGAIVWGTPAVFCANCLFQRVNMFISDWNGPTSSSFYNNLFLDGELEYEHSDVGPWTIRDNLFDRALVSTWSDPIDICSNNAYVRTNYGFVLPRNNDVTLTNSPNYEAGDLGDYYYPSGQTNLIFQGSRPAPAAGLYHYTVTTNNVIEGTNQVSIGFHYVACGTNGLPLDTNGDGIPDYLEDINGNGLIDSGEIAWNVAGDLGLTVVITQPANNSKIP